MKKNLPILGYISITIILTITFINVLNPNKDNSDENRELSAKPVFNVKDVISNDYQKEYDKYLEDNFALKKSWKSIKTNFEKFIGLKKIDNIYFGKNDRLIEDAVVPKEKDLKNKVKLINSFNKSYRNKDLKFVLIPNKIGIYKGELDNAYDQQKLYKRFTKDLDDSIDVVDTFSILNSHKKEKIYYNTDHHYTTLGAKYLYENMYKKTDNTYKKYIVNDKFYGTSSNRISYYKKADTVLLYEKKTDIKYFVDYGKGKKEQVTLYDKSKQFSENPYEIFFGGNYPVIDIKTTSKSDDRLLIIKDSYANSFIPFILDEYCEIVMVDPRYYRNSIDEIIEEKDINKLMIFYNMNTFFLDNSFDRMIESTLY